MGGGARFAHPKWVWTYYGGWWPEPKNAKLNTLITFGAIAGLTGVVWSYSADKERRIMYPRNWIPSMLWAKEFHDPQHVAFWKEQLAKEGRQWIEPIPDSMKSWWPLYRTDKQQGKVGKADLEL
ncbi:hypothetical protein BDR26DRAFT_583799 [Obelidium mucronatum]|nr:hypothetical protein BDR26DRAFT_583799 [Obelidium mucronatum]